jgi:hypothetical protein
MKTMGWIRWLSVGALALLGACQPDQLCDEGYAFSDGQCIPAPKTAQDAGADSGADAGGHDGAVTFGTPCTDSVNHTECQSQNTTVCLMAPGDTSGQCSAINCDRNPSICPSGWSCLDLSVIQPGAPFGCVPF